MRPGSYEVVMLFRSGMLVIVSSLNEVLLVVKRNGLIT